MSKKYFTSNTPSSGMSVQCTALRTRSCPNLALYKQLILTHMQKMDLPDRIGSEMLSNFRVMRSAEVSEGSHGALLSDLESE